MSDSRSCTNQGCKLSDRHSSNSSPCHDEHSTPPFLPILPRQQTLIFLNPLKPVRRPIEAVFRRSEGTVSGSFADYSQKGSLGKEAMERTLSPAIASFRLDFTTIKKLAGSRRYESHGKRKTIRKRPFLSEKPLCEVLKQYQMEETV